MPLAIFTAKYVKDRVRGVSTVRVVRGISTNSFSEGCSTAKCSEGRPAVGVCKGEVRC